MDSERLADALDYIHENAIPIHSLQIIRNGYLVLNAYFYPFDANNVHDGASVTKSVTATLIGIAIDQGHIASVGESVVSLFPGRDISNRDAAKETVTVEDLLTMQPGLECDAEPGEPTLRQMRQSPDWVQFMLDRPIVGRSGEHFVYCSPGMHLLSGLISQTTGETAREFARRNLFEPLGIRDFVWPSDPQGNSFGWGDLHLHPRDLAKLGFLYLHDGLWDGQQVLSAQWVRAATRVHANTGLGTEYGYGWWVFTGSRVGQYEAVGRGGQRITIIPEENLVVVFTGGGFEPGSVGDLLAQALGTNERLPENPDGASRLEASVAMGSEPPVPTAIAPLPQTAVRVSGKSYPLTTNDLGLQTMEISFPSQIEGVLTLTFTDGRSETRPIGLDGVPRISADGRFGLPVALSGEWESSDSFLLNYDEIGNINMFRMTLTFDDTRLAVNVAERTDGTEFGFAGEESAADSTP